MRAVARDGLGTSDTHRACTALHDHFSPGLKRLAVGILGPGQSARRVVAEVFSYVWENAREYDVERGSVGAWLRAITRHRAIDALRRNAGRRMAEEPAAGDDIDTGAGPVTGGSDLPGDTLLHSALSALTPLRQQLLRLAFFDGLSQAEIARASGIAPASVKSQVRRATQDMRSVLGLPDGPASDRPTRR
jgi:RNA polymerase sigma-70 factor (ECF subfamily)